MDSKIRPKSFVEELMDLVTTTGQNGDYYVDGYVDAGDIAELINKWYPEYEFSSYGTWREWRPPRPKNNLSTLLPAIYQQQITKQITHASNLLTGFALIKPKTDKKDDEN